VACSDDGDMVSLDDLPLIHTWRAMEACKEKSLCKDTGVSNFSKKKLQDLCKQAKIKPAVNQIELHPYLQMKDLLAYGEKEGIHFTAYSQLAGVQGSSSSFPQERQREANTGTQNHW
jgi:alcohol dehydrogenase (NADP+)